MLYPHGTFNRLIRNENESWEDCILRHARISCGRGTEVLLTFEKLRLLGVSECNAAFMACWKWEIV